MFYKHCINYLSYDLAVFLLLFLKKIIYFIFFRVALSDRKIEQKVQTVPIYLI